MLPASIIINNYNYGRFLSQAIDSALQQTYRPVEVIVVDDGSTDDSRATIASYGSAIVPVLKGNGGQASAFNAGFARAHGEVVIFLDADDRLVPDIVQRVAAVFQDNPQAAKVQYRLEVIEAGGGRTGVVKPPWGRSLPGGDLRSKVLAFPDDIPWQPTSGNAFASRVLRRIFPVPEDIYRLCADYYLSNLPPLFGPVISLDQVGGYYRVHGSNNHQTSAFSLDQSREIITRTCHTHDYIKAAADSLNLSGFPSNAADVRSVTFLAHRLVSLKLDPQRHPIQEDRPLSVFARGVSASLRRFDLPWIARFLYSLWFIAVLFAPRSGVRWLAQGFFYPETQSHLTRLFSMVQNLRPPIKSQEDQN